MFLCTIPHYKLNILFALCRKLYTHARHYALIFIIHHYNLNLLTTSYIQITMTMNNDIGGHNVKLGVNNERGVS